MIKLWFLSQLPSTNRSPLISDKGGDFENFHSRIDSYRDVLSSDQLAIRFGSLSFTQYVFDLEFHLGVVVRWGAVVRDLLVCTH